MAKILYYIMNDKVFVSGLLCDSRKPYKHNTWNDIQLSIGFFHIIFVYMVQAHDILLYLCLAELHSLLFLNSK